MRPSQQHQLWGLLSGSGWLGWRTAGMPLDLCGGKLAALPIDPLLPLLPSPLFKSLLAAQHRLSLSPWVGRA